MSLYIPIILGTARAGRRSESVARHVLAFAQTLDIETELLDVKDYRQAFTQEATPAMSAWLEKAKRADGFIVVTPEYNHGYPGELKMFLDHGYTESNRKPIGFVGVSTGPLGGARGIEQLRLVSIEFQMIPLRTAVYVGNIIDALDEHNTLKDTTELDKKLKLLFDECVWYARVLREERIAWNAAREIKK
jgi:NAD(P)H-dependent FMN reductase